MRKILLAIACVMTAQTANAQQACTYDSCALRIENAHVVAGQHGAAIGRLGLISTPGLDDRLSLPDSAAAHYRIFKDNYVSGNLWSILGSVTITLVMISPAISGREFASSDAVITAGTIAGVVATIIGARKSSKAHAELARSIWWYNRELPR